MNASKSLSNISGDRNLWFAQYRKELQERDYRSGLSAAETRGIAQGMAQGMAQGERDAKLETARILKQSNVDLSLIAKSTGLSAEEISRL